LCDISYPEGGSRVHGKALVELGEENPDIVVLDADLSHSTMTMHFAARFPQRFFNCGIAEQDLIGISSGLAASGKIPFASSFAVFVELKGVWDISLPHLSCL
jgi:transketolase